MSCKVSSGRSLRAFVRAVLVRDLLRSGCPRMTKVVWEDMAARWGVVVRNSARTLRPTGEAGSGQGDDVATRRERGRLHALRARLGMRRTRSRGADGSDSVACLGPKARSR